MKKSKFSKRNLSRTLSTFLSLSLLSPTNLIKVKAINYLDEAKEIIQYIKRGTTYDNLKARIKACIKNGWKSNSEDPDIVLSQIISLGNKNGNVTKFFSDAVAEIHQENINELQNQATELTASVKKLRKDIAPNQADVEFEESDLSKLTATIRSTLNQDRERMQGEIQSQTNQIAKLTNSNKAEEQSFRLLQLQYDDIQRALQKVSQELDQVKQINYNTKQGIKSINSQIPSLSEDLTKSLEIKKNLEDRINDACVEIEGSKLIPKIAELTSLEEWNISFQKCLLSSYDPESDLKDDYLTFMCDLKTNEEVLKNRNEIILALVKLAEAEHIDLNRIEELNGIVAKIVAEIPQSGQDGT
jgi:chromosome segregation ATPase